MKVTIMEKAHISRSGATAAGMDAINTYIPEGKTPEDLVRWSRSQVGGGPIREDLALSNAQELNTAVDDLAEWGLPIIRDEDGNPEYRGGWDISIHGEQLKPLMAEKAQDLLYRALEAFIRQDVALARAIPPEDDDVDALYNQINRDLLDSILADPSPSTIDCANLLTWAAHNLEGAADRVTNLFERVVFTVTGEMVEMDNG